MNELYNQKERYNKYFLEIIKNLKNARPTKDYKELKLIYTPDHYQLMYAMSSSYEIIEDYKFSVIEFLCFTFYYILKCKEKYNMYLYVFFDNFSDHMKPDYLKYIQIFIILLMSKNEINLYKHNMLFLLIEYKYNYKNNYELYLEYLHNLFFYGVFY